MIPVAPHGLGEGISWKIPTWDICCKVGCLRRNSAVLFHFCLSIGKKKHTWSSIHLEPFVCQRMFYCLFKFSKNIKAEQSSTVEPFSPCCSVSSECSWAGAAKFPTTWNMQRVPLIYSWKIISYLQIEPHLFPPARGESGLNPCLVFPQLLQNTEYRLQLGAWLSLCFFSSGKNSFSWCRLYLHLYLFICIQIFVPYSWKVKIFQLF